MKATAIIGANYGDEGKGLMTDYVCSQGADVVVRFNGGAQAGHTVQTPETRHVFHHYGSGSFLGVPTFLSRFFITNPILFAEEKMVGKVYVDPRSIVTTPIDMLINQALEKKRGHGSCGVGINETVRRSTMERYRITVGNIADPSIYHRIMSEYLPLRLAETGLELEIAPHWEEVFYGHVNRFLKAVELTERPPGKSFVFEGAQGLMLDQSSPDFPHVTHSHTGMRNVSELCQQWGIRNVQAIYVTRSYLTRHGNGPLPNEQTMPDFVKDETNVPHEFQGTLRYAPLDVIELERRILADASVPFSVAVTCLDQFDCGKKFRLPVSHVSYGPTREDVRKVLPTATWQKAA